MNNNLTTELQPVNEKGWRLGFSNIFINESKKWWGTRRWIVQSIIRLVIINGIVALTIIEFEPGFHSAEEGVEMMLIFQFLFASIGVILTMQNLIVGEKLEGTAAWVLSKPLTRTAFILARTLATIIPSFFIMFIIQFAVGYYQITSYTGYQLDLNPLLIAEGIGMLHLLFYITLTLFTGTIFNSRAPVIGIPLVVLFGQSIVGPKIAYEISSYFPGMMIGNIGDIGMGLAPVPTQAVIVLIVGIILFLVAAVYRFQREEF